MRRSKIRNPASKTPMAPHRPHNSGKGPPSRLLERSPVDVNLVIPRFGGAPGPLAKVVGEGRTFNRAGKDRAKPVGVDVVAPCDEAAS